MVSHWLSTSELRIEISDNEANGKHRRGYNGISSLTSVHAPKTLFYPWYAGINFEYIWNGTKELHNQSLFEPRRWPMTAHKVDENTVLLHQEPTPIYGLESWTTYRTSGDYAVDIEFRCLMHKNGFPNNYLDLFWASYMNEPENKSIYFCNGTAETGEPVWQQFCSYQHGHESSVLPRSEDVGGKLLNTDDGYLIDSYAPVRFTKPFYYGLNGPMVFALLFEKEEGLRFAHSPTGGGSDNPAWDFHYVINNPTVGGEFRWKARMIYKRFEGRDDILQEYERFVAGK